MTWPIATATKNNLDSSADDPSQARVELAAAIDRLNEVIGILSQTPGGNQVIVLAANGDMNLGSTLAAYPRGASQNFGYAAYVAHAGKSGAGLTANAYLDNGVWKRLVTGVAKAIFLDATGEPQFYLAGSGAADSTITWTTNTMWHAGNDGSGSGLDADVVRGKRILNGVVNSAGAILSGTGFTVSKGSTGIYNITFSPVFASDPTVVTSSLVAGYNSSAPSPVYNSVQIVTTNGSGTLIDSAFSFVAIGPN